MRRARLDRTQPAAPRSSAAPPGAHGGRIACLDGWRGLAIALVMVGHFGPGRQWLPLADFGVDCFFALSGRLMADILTVQRYDLATFFQRRLSRILPALLAFTLPTFVAGSLAAAYLPVGSTHVVDALDLVAALTFWTNYLLAFGQVNSIFTHTWSLAVEEHSYLLLALVAGVIGRSYGRFALVCALLALCGLLHGMVLQHATGLSGGLIFARSDVRAASILLAAAIFAQLRRGGVALLPWPAVTPVLCLPAAAAIACTEGFGILSYPAVCGLVGLSVNHLEFCAEGLRRVFEAAWLRGLGIISYSLYLWQEPFYLASRKFETVPTVIGALLLSAGFALASFFLVEQPSRRALNRAWDELRRRAPLARRGDAPVGMLAAPRDGKPG